MAQKVLHPILHLVASQGWDVAPKVLYGVEHSAILDDGNTDSVDVGIEYVRAMHGRVHPGPLDLSHAVAVACHDFSDRAEARSGLRGPGDDVRLAELLMHLRRGAADAQDD